MTALEELQEHYPTTIRIAGIKVRGRGDIKKMGVGDAVLRAGDHVILSVSREPTYGIVHTEPLPMPFIPPMRVMQSIVRPATEADRAQIRATNGWPKRG